MCIRSTRSLFPFLFSNFITMVIHSLLAPLKSRIKASAFYFSSFTW